MKSRKTKQKGDVEIGQNKRQEDNEEHETGGKQDREKEREQRQDKRKQEIRGRERGKG